MYKFQNNCICDSLACVNRKPPCAVEFNIKFGSEERYIGLKPLKRGTIN